LPLITKAIRKYIIKKDIYKVIGSSLASCENCIIWGTGFIRYSDRVKKKPKKICAVRGQLSRKILLNQNIKCPNIVGDPALLYPRFYKPKIKKKYKIGFVPHFRDKTDFNLIKKFNQFLNSENIVIDIEQETNKFVDQINSCECIASSSLHGIIASDAYGIPSIWIKPSDNPLGDGFKFYDYFSSVNRKCDPLIIKTSTKLSNIQNAFKDYTIDIDLDLLYESCPFRK